MRQDDFSNMTVELDAARSGLRQVSVPAVGRTEPTVELYRPPVAGGACPDQTLELGDCDIEPMVVPPPPPPNTLATAFGGDIDEDLFAFVADAPPLAAARDLDTEETGLRAFFRRLFFRLGWVHFEDTSMPSPLAGPSS